MEQRGILCAKPEDWQYSSARNWILGDDSIVKINREIRNDGGRSPHPLAALDWEIQGDLEVRVRDKKLD